MGPKYYQLNSSSDKIPLDDFQSDIEPMLQELIEKWSTRNSQIVSEKHNIKNEMASLDIEILRV